jgi:hypothetical protein
VKCELREYPTFCVTDIWVKDYLAVERETADEW